jgi:cell division transport system permease protein
VRNDEHEPTPADDAGTDETGGPPIDGSAGDPGVSAPSAGAGQIDVVDDGFSRRAPDGAGPAGPPPIGTSASTEALQAATLVADPPEGFDGTEGLRGDSADHDAAISTFLSGEAAVTSLREKPGTRFMSMLGYAVRDAARGIRRRPGLAASAALTVSLCAALAGGAAVARAGVDATMARWADGVEFVVYLQPGATKADVARVRAELEGSDGVRSVTRVTQQEAYEEYQRLYANESRMVEAVTPDLLPSSFRVAPERADPALIRRITRPLESDAAVYQVVTADDAVRDVRDLSGAVSGVGTWLAIVLGVVGAVLSATMIRSSISARRKEIEMMRSFGAGRTYIAAPVAIEGVMIGLVGAGLAASLLVVGLARAAGSSSSVVTSLLPATGTGRAVILAVVVLTVLICTLVSVATTAGALRRAR